jgi:type I restriction enzyme S subunit
MMFYKETNFKETPIGKIPKDWEVNELKKVSVLIKSGSTPLKSKRDYWNGNIPFVTQADMTKVERYLHETSERITELGAKSSNLFIVPENSILLSMYGTIGKVVINKVPVTVSQNIAAIVLDKKCVHEEYLRYVLQMYSHQFKRQAKIITLRHLDIRIVKKTLLPFPRLLEQQKIASILSTVDEAIQKTDEIIAKTERLKKGLMHELLTKGIGHKEFKDTEIGRIPKDWEVVKVGDILSLEYGSGLPERERIPGMYPVVGSNGIVGYHNQAIVNGPGIVIGRKGTIGAVSWIDKDFWPIDTTYYVKLKISDVFLKWLFYELIYLNPARFHLADVVPGLKRELVHSLKMPLPPLPEQQRIAKILFTVDKKLEIEGNEKAKLERIKQGLMDLLLTGKIRVKVD